MKVYVVKIDRIKSSKKFVKVTMSTYYTYFIIFPNFFDKYKKTFNDPFGLRCYENTEKMHTFHTKKLERVPEVHFRGQKRYFLMFFKNPFLKRISPVRSWIRKSRVFGE